MKYKLLLVLFFFSTTAFAQIQNQKGSIVLKNGETLSGSVTYFYDNPNKLHFYDEAGKKQLFEPNQIKEINLINGDKFVIKSYGGVNQDSTSLILQALIESPNISLYSKEVGTYHYFYVTKNNVLYKLENNDVIEERGVKTYRRKDYKYISTLSILMADRIVLLERMENIKLSEDDLTRIIMDYNNGAVTYNKKKDSKVAKDPNWVFFANYSQQGSFSGSYTDALSDGQEAGLQFYFSTHSRHSIKMGLGHIRYRYNSGDIFMSGLSFKYELALKQSKRYNLYFSLHVADLGRRTGDISNAWQETDEGIVLVPRLIPGLGFELRPLSRIALYGELNHILDLNQIPKIFSFGIKYDFGKTSW